MSAQWTPDMDAALTLYTNRLCQHLCVSPARLHPHEIYLSDAELASIDYACLQGGCFALFAGDANRGELKTKLATKFIFSDGIKRKCVCARVFLNLLREESKLMPQ